MAEELVNDFCAEDFDVEKFLAIETEQHDLKEILAKLQEYKKANSATMATVLKEQTDAVVSIAEELQRLNNKVESMTSPVAQLSEELRLLQTRVNSSVKSYRKAVTSDIEINQDLFRIHSMKAYKIIVRDTLFLLSRFMCNIHEDKDQLSRLVTKFALQDQIMKSFNHEVNKKEDISGRLHSLLQEKFLIAYDKRSSEDLRHVIDLFVDLKMVQTLSKIIQENIVKPLLSKIFCERYLQQQKGSMKKVYQSALNILTNNLEILMREEFEDFNVILDCYWIVADQLLRDNLLSITSAGHVDVFFRHFNDTVMYLQKISEIYGNENLVRIYDPFVNHLKRFNLLVYYEIRHQEVCSALESSILLNSEFDSMLINTGSAKHNFKLQVTFSLYAQIAYLTHKNVFLPMLSDQFLKSSLLLLSRYFTWINDEVLENLKLYSIDNQKHILLSVLSDISILKLKIGFNISNYDLKNSIFSQIDNSVESILCDILENNNKQLNLNFNKVKNVFLNVIHQEVLKHLQNVGSIPRLYRRTNKNSPVEHSSYVIDALKPIQNFRTFFDSQNPDLLQEQHLIMDELIVKLSNGYITLIADVLESVCKTEESLRRLKQRNTSPRDDLNNDNNSDEAKIRLQIKFDAGYLVTNLEKLALKQGKVALQTLMKESGI